jgi:hypothetical protein
LQCLQPEDIGHVGVARQASTDTPEQPPGDVGPVGATAMNPKGPRFVFSKSVIGRSGWRSSFACELLLGRSVVAPERDIIYHLPWHLSFPQTRCSLHLDSAMHRPGKVDVSQRGDACLSMG